MLGKADYTALMYLPFLNKMSLINYKGFESISITSCITLLHILLLIIISGVKETNWYITQETASMLAQSVTSPET